MGVVIFHPEDGVFLGECLGLGFWSNLDSAGQPGAVAFDNEKKAEEFMASWTGGRPDGVSLVEVSSKDGFASLADCLAAGLPGWLNENTAAANIRPS